MDRDKLPVEKALGMFWNIENDTFGFQVAVNTKALTRRAVLSTVSSVYDPLGLVAPFVLKAKLILQELCQIKCGWDTIIPSGLSQLYKKKWLNELEQLKHFQINRCLKPKHFGQSD